MVLNENTRTKSRLGETAREIVLALLLAVFIRTFLFQPFNIPSGSMEPTLLVGDYLFVSKFSYGYSHYSLPFSPPLFSGRLFSARPHRGDVVVFRPPGNDSVDYIKRIIGLPGDRIQLIDGFLHINGTPATRERVADFMGANPCGPGGDVVYPVRVARWRETLPNGVSYDTLQCPSFSGFPDTTGVYIVPPGHYFMMGDNRENSEDSRFPDVGYVPFENIIGKAQMIFFSIAHGDSAWENWPWSVRWNRLFTTVR
ncbi:signal peptidase I [Mesorhizobium mediterraneum]|uniref:signal peptidase I n=1 Tax=Mesorhizobium mediterraneum TaxID=43617 RepID=UPI00177FC904|nr:signal peptidase I [Mesorhizobium mediterraneum]